jgi:hypothetical protein
MAAILHLILKKGYDLIFKDWIKDTNYINKS